MRIEPATAADLDALGRLGAHLMRLHHGYDPDRFLAPGADPESGYAWFLETQLARDDCIVLVARDGDDTIGYVYAGLEPHSWKELRDAAGFVHDLVVAEHARHRGVGRALMAAAEAWLRDHGAPRVVLWTSPQNHDAGALFRRGGYRETLKEMTKEL